MQAGADRDGIASPLFCVATIVCTITDNMAPCFKATYICDPSGKSYMRPQIEFSTIVFQVGAVSRSLQEIRIIERAAKVREGSELL